MEQWVTTSLLLVLLTIGSLWDWRTGRVPNWLTLPAILIGLIWWIGLGGWLAYQSHDVAIIDGLFSGLVRSFLAMLMGGLPFCLLFAIGGLGGGDVKLMAAFGAISGRWMCVMDAMVYTLVVAGLMAIGLVIWRRRGRQTAQRLWGLILMAMARQKASWWTEASDQQVMRLPFAVAMGVGGGIAVAETILGVTWPWTGW